MHSGYQVDPIARVNWWMRWALVAWLAIDAGLFLLAWTSGRL